LLIRRTRTDGVAIVYFPDGVMSICSIYAARGGTGFQGDRSPERMSLPVGSSSGTAVAVHDVSPGDVAPGVLAIQRG
jgi:hypothetical protein